MQKFVLAVLALITMTVAAPQQNPQAPQEVYILRHDSEVSPDGYQFAFETSDGTSRQEQGSLKQISEGQHALTVQGSYRYTAPDGLIYTVTFTADENGFKPQEHVEHPGSQ